MFMFCSIRQIRNDELVKSPLATADRVASPALLAMTALKPLG
jgi:hypothetical protein